MAGLESHEAIILTLLIGKFLETVRSEGNTRMKGAQYEGEKSDK